MEKDIKYLLLPDTHGRQFWIEPVKEVLENTDAKICFLGDYLSPYPYEWEDGVDYNRVSIERFKEIIQLKKDNPDRVTLLLGNHDATYAIGPNICECRMDRRNFSEIEKLFRDNRELFQIAEETELAGRKIMFSHAGIFKEWAKSVWGEDAEADDFKVIDRLNDAWLMENYAILRRLGDYDNYRGWGGVRYASPVWADIRSWYGVKPEETYGYNIVGHTQPAKEEPVLFKTIACVDCHRAFYLDDEGFIRDYGNDEAYDVLTVIGNE